MKKIYFLCLILASSFVVSCSKDDDGNYELNRLNYQNRSFEIVESSFYTNTSTTIRDSVTHTTNTINFYGLLLKSSEYKMRDDDVYRRIEMYVGSFINKPEVGTYKFPQDDPYYFLNNNTGKYQQFGPKIVSRAKKGEIKIISVDPILEIKFEGTLDEGEPFKGYFKGVVDWPEEWVE